MVNLNIAKEGYWKVPYSVIANPDMPLDAKGLLMYFVSHCSKDKNYCFPSRDTILKDLNISKPTYLKYMKLLEEKGYIKPERTNSNKLKRIYLTGDAVYSEPDRYCVVPRTIMLDNKLNIREKAFLILFSFMKILGENICRDNICTKAAITKNTFSEYINKLCEIGYLKYNGQLRSNGEFGLSDYTVCWTTSPTPCTKTLASPCTETLPAPYTESLTSPCTETLPHNKKYITTNPITVSVYPTEKVIPTTEPQTDGQGEVLVLEDEKLISELLTDIRTQSEKAESEGYSALHTQFERQLTSLIFSKAIYDIALRKMLVSYLKTTENISDAAKLLFADTKARFDKYSEREQIRNISGYLKSIIKTVIENHAAEAEVFGNITRSYSSSDCSLPETVFKALQA